MSAIAILGRTWAVWIPAVLIGAVIQALLVAPFVTPGASWAFVALTAAALAALVTQLTVVGGAYRAALDGARFGWPRGIAWLGILALVVAVALAAVASPWLVIPAATIALVILPAILGVPGRHAGGFTLFRRAPVRALLLTLVSLILVALAWLASLLLGLFVTGWVGAGLTWLLYGLIGVILVAAWVATPRRDRD